MAVMKPAGRTSQTSGAGTSAARDSAVRDSAVSFPELNGVTHRFIELPGLRMHVAEAGEGAPLVLLHGFPQHWWAWRKVIPELAAHYRVIMPDLRGAGWTDAPPDGYTREQLLADVVALLDALQLEKVNVLGYDWGGILGFRLCLARPDRVQRFVCIAAPHPYPRLRLKALLSTWRIWPMFANATPGLGPWLLRSGRQRFPRWLMTGDTSDPTVFAPDDIDAFVSRLKDPARAHAGSALYRHFILSEANRSLSGAYRGTRLQTPTMLLYGIVLYGNEHPSREHPEVIGGYEDYADDVTPVHVPGTGYYIAEERPDVVINRALEFLSAPRN